MSGPPPPGEAAARPWTRGGTPNTALKQLLGWSRLELLGRPLSLVIPRGLPGVPLDDPPAPPQGPGPQTPGPTPSRPPLRVSARQRDGGEREVEVRLSRWRGDEVEGLLLLSFRSLEAQVELERQLQRHHRLNMLDALLEHALTHVMDEETAAYATLRACEETEGWALGTYWEVDTEKTLPRPLTVWTASSALSEFVEKTLQRTFTPGAGLPGRAWSHREPVWIRDVAVEPHFARAEEAARQGLHGGLFMPVLGGGRLHGVLELFRREPLTERESDEALANALGHRLGRFFDRLNHEREEHTRDLALLRLWDADGHLAGTLGLAVDVTQREREARWRTRLLEEAEEARLEAEQEVTDHGIGIAPENLERIFGKFERAVSVRQYGGFGLGLSIVRQLVEALGGAVDVASTVGKGSTFRIVLPLAGPELRPVAPSPSAPGLH
ncbi:ATP-binding protein [Archangium sp.]|uniref:ATP-binding protein n=1 Tax=Archangium sp. TaxID=1872627 RepID=UPI00286BBABE|nr:ATP-binding protein [Archangium sp.]